MSFGESFETQVAKFRGESSFWGFRCFYSFELICDHFSLCHLCDDLREEGTEKVPGWRLLPGDNVMVWYLGGKEEGKSFRITLCRLIGKGEMRSRMRTCGAWESLGNGVIHVKCQFDWICWICGTLLDPHGDGYWSIWCGTVKYYKICTYKTETKPFAFYFNAVF